VLGRFPPLDDLPGRKLATGRAAVMVRDRVDRDTMHPRAHVLDTLELGAV